MIYDTGRNAATKHQKALSIAHGDDSFTALIPAAFPIPTLPMMNGWQYDLLTGIVLKMRCVMPHTDTWLGRSPSPSLKKRAAFFWLVSAPESCDFHLQVGRDYRRLSQGDWVLFDDSVLHCVTAEKKWSGIAIQVRKTKPNPDVV